MVKYFYHGSCYFHLSTEIFNVQENCDVKVLCFLIVQIVQLLLYFS